MKKFLVAALLAVALLAGGAAFAQRPVENINPNKHPNLAAAQRHSQEAYEKVLAAQEANEWDMNGHAQRAKELLEQVNQELKLAAQTANKNHR